MIDYRFNGRYRGRIIRLLYHKRSNEDDNGRNTGKKQGEKHSMVTMTTATTITTTQSSEINFTIKSLLNLLSSQTSGHSLTNGSNPSPTFRSLLRQQKQFLGNFWFYWLGCNFTNSITRLNWEIQLGLV